MKPHEPADWSEIRRRIGALRAPTATSGTLTAAEERCLLHTRAQALAEPLAAEAAAGAILEAVEFDLAGERYAFPLTAVREVSLLHALTPVPGTPPFLLGIVNLRGEIRPVLDLQRFFGQPAASLTQLNQLLVIEHDDLTVGILADAIRGVRHLPIAALQRAPADPRAPYLRGATADGLLLLDAARLLADPRLLVDDREDS